MKNYDVQSIAVKVSYDKAFGYIADPRNLPKWTNAFKQADSKGALMATPHGEIAIKLRVVSNVVYGNVDWFMTFPDGAEGRAFSRVVSVSQNETIYSFVLLAPPVPLEQLEGALSEQTEILSKELQHLKEILEGK